MKRLLALLVVLLASPLAHAGAPVATTILTDRVPPYLFPQSGATVPLGQSTTVTVVLSKGNSTAQLSLLNLLPGSDYQITGGTCVQNFSTFVAPSDSCTIDIQFTPTTTGTRTGTLQVDCVPFVVPGGIAVTCDTSPTSIASIALSGLAALVASAPVPGLGRYELTALALLLFAMAGWSLRRRP